VVITVVGVVETVVEEAVATAVVEAVVTVAEEAVVMVVAEEVVITEAEVVATAVVAEAAAYQVSFLCMTDIKCDLTDHKVPASHSVLEFELNHFVNHHFTDDMYASFMSLLKQAEIATWVSFKEFCS
jgi:hypothetical protein